MSDVSGEKRPPRERWWKRDQDGDAAACQGVEPREGQPCPSCLLGELTFNGLFQLECDTCGRVHESAVFT